MSPAEITQLIYLGHAAVFCMVILLALAAFCVIGMTCIAIVDLGWRWLRKDHRARCTDLRWFPVKKRNSS